MKLKLPVIYGQRDSRWSSILLGYNTNQPYTIGNYGCLITCLGCIVNKTPSETNEILKANNGFVSGGLFVFSKCTSLGLTQIYKSPYYSDPVTNQGIAKMKELLDNGSALLTHVDFNPADTDDDMHWVLVYGYEENTENFYAMDPWTGTLITLDVYGGTRRAVYEFVGYTPTLSKETTTSCQDELDKCRLARDEHWNELQRIANKLNVQNSETVIMGELEKLIGYEDALVVKDREKTELQKRIEELEKQLGEKSTELEMMKKTNEELQISIKEKSDELTVQAMEHQQTIQDMDKEIKVAQKELEKLKDSCVNNTVFTGIKKIIYDWLLKF